MIMRHNLYDVTDAETYQVATPEDSYVRIETNDVIFTQTNIDDLLAVQFGDAPQSSSNYLSLMDSPLHFKQKQVLEFFGNNRYIFVTRNAGIPTEALIILGVITGNRDSRVAILPNTENLTDMYVEGDR
jgi:hypothetical protein